jgi:hypothetical protein
MESVIREFIHYQKGIAFLEPQAYVDIVELDFLGEDLQETFPMLNTYASYDKESESFNRAMAVYRKCAEKKITFDDAPFDNAFEFASNVVVAECEKLYYLYANKLESMGVPASEIFSGEYFDALFEHKAKAAEEKQEEDEETPVIIVGQAYIIDCNGVPQIITFYSSPLC